MTLLNLVTQLDDELKGNYDDPFKVFSITKLLSDGLTLALVIGAIIVFVCLLWGGYQWMTAGGETGKIEAAKARLTQCLVGFAILAVSYTIAILVSYFLGIDVLQPLPNTVWSPPTAGGPPPAPPGPGTPGTACNPSNPTACGECGVCLSDAGGNYTCSPDPGRDCSVACQAGRCTSNPTNPTCVKQAYSCTGLACPPNDCGEGTCEGGVCVEPTLPIATPTPTPIVAVPLTWSSCGSGVDQGAFPCNVGSVVWGATCTNPGEKKFCQFADCRGGVTACANTAGEPTVGWECVCTNDRQYVLNSYSSFSCNQICNNLGWGSCLSVGTDDGASNSLYYGAGCQELAADCNTVMRGQGPPLEQCGGQTAVWTNCRCG